MWRAASWQESADKENGWMDGEEERGRRLFTLLAGDPELPVERKDVRNLNHRDKSSSEQRSNKSCSTVPWSCMVNGLKSKLRGPLQGYDSNKPSNTPLCTQAHAHIYCKSTEKCYSRYLNIGSERCEILHYTVQLHLKVLCGVKCQWLNLKSLLGPSVEYFLS